MSMFDLFKEKQPPSSGPFKKADHKTVDSRIKTLVWPLLKKEGFREFTPRTAWRHLDNQIQVLNFQSFDTHTASIIKCTTYSLTINLGCYFKKIPDRFGRKIKTKKGIPHPLEYECHLRCRLHKTIDQKDLPRKDIWSIERSGANMDLVFEDIKKVLKADGFPWFDKYMKDSEVLRTLLHDKEKSDRKGLTLGTFGFGANPSPLRDYLTGYVSLEMGERGLAKKHLTRALESGRFPKVELRLKKDIPR